MHVSHGSKCRSTNSKQCAHCGKHGPRAHAQSCSAEEAEAAYNAFLVKGVAPGLAVALAQVQQQGDEKGSKCNCCSCSSRR